MKKRILLLLSAIIDSLIKFISIVYAILLYVIVGTVIFIPLLLLVLLFAIVLIPIVILSIPLVIYNYIKEIIQKKRNDKVEWVEAKIISDDDTKS